MADPYTLDLAAWQTEQALRRGQVPADQVDFAKSALARYDVRVQEEHRPRFSAMTERGQQEERMLQSHFLDADNGLDEAQQQQLDETLQYSPDPAEDRAQTFNSEFFASRFGVDRARVAAEYPMYEAEYAKQEMGNEHAAATQVFDHIKNGLDLDLNLSHAAYNTALIEESTGTAFVKWKATGEAHKGWNKGKEASYWQRFQKFNDAYDEQLSEFRGVITSTVNDLERLYGTEKARPGEGEGLDVLARRLIGVPKAKRQFVLRAIADTAELRGQDVKGFVKQLGESFARGAEKLWSGMGEAPAAAVLQMLPDLLSRVRGVPWDTKDAAGDALAQAEAFYQGMKLHQDNEKLRPLTDEERMLAKAKVESALDTFDLAADIRDIGEHRTDPIRGDYLITRGLYGAAESVPYTLAAMVPGIGLPLTMEAMATDNYHQMRRDNPDADRSRLRSLAQVAAVPQVLLERIEGKFLFGKMPTFGAFLSKAITPRAGAALRFGVRLAEQTGTEMVEENAQDLMPAFVQSLAHAIDADIPGANMERVFSQFSQANQMELLATVVTMSIIGSGAGTWHDVKRSRELLSDRRLVRPFVESDEQARTITDLAVKGDMDGAARLFNEQAAPKLKEGMTFPKAFEEAVEEQTKRAQEFHAKAVADAEAQRTQQGAAQGEALGIFPSVKVSSSGVQLHFNDGTTPPLNFATRSEADAARWQMVEEAGWKLHEKVRNQVREAEKADPDARFRAERDPRGKNGVRVEPEKAAEVKDERPGESGDKAQPGIPREARANEPRDDSTASNPETLFKDRENSAREDNGAPDDRGANDKLEPLTRGEEPRVREKGEPAEPVSDERAYAEASAMADAVSPDLETRAAARGVLGNNVAEFKARVRQVAETLGQQGKSMAAKVREVMADHAARMIGEGRKGFLVAGLREVEQALGTRGEQRSWLPHGDESRLSDQEVVDAFADFGAEYLGGGEGKEGSGAVESPITPQRGNDSFPRWLYSKIQGSRLGPFVDALVRSIQHALRRGAVLSGLAPKSAQSVEELLKVAGIDEHTRSMSPRQAKRLVEALRKDNPVTVDEVVLPMAGWGEFNKVRLASIIQEVLDFVPPKLAKKLKDHLVTVELVPREELEKDGEMRDGEYHNWVVKINRDSVQTQTEMRRVMFHELVHWLEHADYVGGGHYKAEIDAFVLGRTKGSNTFEPLQKRHGEFYKPPVRGIRDDFGDITGNEYGGREYDGRIGREIPTTRLEKLTHSPKRLADFLNQYKDGKGYTWRESLVVALNIFFD